MTFAAQFGVALRWAWLAVCAVLAPVLLAPFLLPAKTVWALAPVCEWKAKYNRECVLCGMTRGFLLISEGRFREAGRSNRASVPLFALLLGNELVGAWCVRKLVRIRREGRHAADRESDLGSAGVRDADPGLLARIHRH